VRDRPPAPPYIGRLAKPVGEALRMSRARRLPQRRSVSVGDRTPSRAKRGGVGAGHDRRVANDGREEREVPRRVMDELRWSEAITPAMSPLPSHTTALGHDRSRRGESAAAPALGTTLCAGPRTTPHGITAAWWRFAESSVGQARAPSRGGAACTSREAGLHLGPRAGSIGRPTRFWARRRDAHLWCCDTRSHAVSELPTGGSTEM
jgi:hypothetical protein